MARGLARSCFDNVLECFIIKLQIIILNTCINSIKVKIFFLFRTFEFLIFNVDIIGFPDMKARRRFDTR